MGLAKVALTQNMTVFLHEQPKPWKHDPYVQGLSIKKIQMHSATGQASISSGDIINMVQLAMCSTYDATDIFFFSWLNSPIQPRPPL
jgi:hypothetical protein